MATPRITHDQRERIVLTDAESSFPNFTGQGRLWTKVPDGDDPPDFIAPAPHGSIGLELVEWLDGDQMGPAKRRESQREQIRRVLTPNWDKEYQPKNLCAAFPSPRGTQRIALPDEQPLRREFYACAAAVDRAWARDADNWGNSYCETEFSGYLLLGKYFSAIRYIGGEPHGHCWIHEDEDGGAFDPGVTVVTLKQALDRKLSDYSKPDTQAHLMAHGLIELDLLIHGGFNIETYNTPAGHLSLEEIARQGADYYASHPLRAVFNRVWFFHSVMGFPRDLGRVRWLTQLWPDFRIYLGAPSS